MAFTPNVVDGNIILASWGNEIRDRTRQVFATPAERDAQWAAPPNGATCVTLDKFDIWDRIAGVWKARPRFGLVSASYTTDAQGYATIPAAHFGLATVIGGIADNQSPGNGNLTNIATEVRPGTGNLSLVARWMQLNNIGGACNYITNLPMPLSAIAWGTPL